MRAPRATAFAGALLLAALAAAPAPAATPASAAIDAALRAPTLAGAHVGAIAIDADSGAALYARAADDDFVPASTLKLLVGSAALARLGPDFTFTTGVRATGSIAGGALGGDLYLCGGGDGQLSIADLDAAAAAVADAGIRRVTGALVADSSRYDAPRYPPGWEIDDVPYEYAAVPSALALDLNVAHVRVLPGDAIGSPVQLQVNPDSGAFAVENRSITGARASADTTDVARPWDRPETIEITGSYPLGAPLSDDLEPAVPDPATYAIDAFARALAARGVTIVGAVRDGVAPPSAATLWTHRSKPLRALLRDFWPPSTNLIGEQLLEELGASSNASGASGDTRARGIEEEMRWLRAIGVDPRTLTIVDGSGLSAYDRATPRALAAILLADWRGPQRATVLAALPVAGASGTLRSVFTRPPLRGNVLAKTGSMNHARLLAGYLRAHGRTIVFALMVGDWMDASPNAEASLDAARAAFLRALLAT